jgi:cystathionine gamma-lyase/cystathionine gamma-lyase/homocysteine desulfhydrase
VVYKGRSLTEAVAAIIRSRLRLTVYSGTKYFGGHSDVMSGFITTNSDKYFEQLRNIRFYGGMILSPESAWLVRRSLQTFSVRIERQARTTEYLAKQLRRFSRIRKVYYPDIDGEQLTGYSGIIFIEVDDDILMRYSQILKELELFGTGTGMACVTSMIAQPCTGSHASLTDTERSAMGITPNLLRLCIGLEEPEDLLRELTRVFGD